MSTAAAVRQAFADVGITPNGRGGAPARRDPVVERGGLKDETGRPVRPFTKLTYLGRDDIVDVPNSAAGDAMEAEEVFDDHYWRIHPKVTVAGWMNWKALQRHPDPAERPTVPFKEWRATVDQIWDEDKDGNPLGLGPLLS